MSPFELRVAADECAPYYRSYVDRVPAGDLLRHLDGQIGATRAALDPFGGAHEDFAYAAGKWTVRELLRHVVETERVMGYRALRFARRDPTPLPGFDQDLFIEGGRGDPRALAAHLEEFEYLRRANISLLGSFDAETLDVRGNMWDLELSVRALGHLLYGHVDHHLIVLGERYVV